MQLIEGYEKCRVERTNDKVYFLTDGQKKYIIPRGESDRELAVGESVRLFLYHDREGTLYTTLKEPLAALGDFASLKVKSVTPAGLFLDRGLSYDLFAPKGLIKGYFKEGDRAVVRLTPDKQGAGVVATTHLAPWFDHDVEPLEEGQKVSLILFSRTELGFGAVVDNRWEGLLYHSAVYENLNPGDVCEGYITAIRDDRKIDLSLQPGHFRAAAKEARAVLEEALAKAGGFLPYHDGSSPEEIKEALHMSKRRFKSVAGMMMKEGRLRITPKGIEQI